MNRVNPNTVYEVADDIVIATNDSHLPFGSNIWIPEFIERGWIVLPIGTLVTASRVKSIQYKESIDNLGVGNWCMRYLCQVCPPSFDNLNPSKYIPSRKFKTHIPGIWMDRREGCDWIQLGTIVTQGLYADIVLSPNFFNLPKLKINPSKTFELRVELSRKCHCGV